jgi:uncharacterized protein (TIGR02246 family)
MVILSPSLKNWGRGRDPRAPLQLVTAPGPIFYSHPLWAYSEQDQTDFVTKGMRIVTDHAAEREVRALYERILEGWNKASGDDFASPFAEDGEVIGFDGSQNKGRAVIAEEMNKIFSDHATGRYIGKVRSVRFLGPQAALLRAVAGIVPAGESELDPKFNSVQALVAEHAEGEWRAVLYHNTPAQFHGRPDLVESLTEELRAES